MRSGGAARTKRSRRPPRWKHARRGCLADSDPAGDGRRQYVGGPDAPHSLAGPDAHAQAIDMREARRTVPSLPSERHRSPMHTTQLVAPIRVGDVRPRDERSRRLDLSRPFFLANALRPPGCGIHIGNKSGQRSQKSFEKLQKLRKLRPFLALKKRPLWWASLYSRALTTICVDEVPAPRSRPTTVRQGNGGL